MSYIPDYRKETDRLSDEDKAFIAGYRAAMQDAASFFDNTEVYEATKEEAKVLCEAKECFEDWTDMQEIQTVCSLFDNADYLPEDLELTDANEPLYKNTKGGKSNGTVY